MEAINSIGNLGGFTEPALISAILTLSIEVRRHHDEGKLELTNSIK
ncbi:MAG: hypothetical protein ACSLEN_02230 [Candidatus Malihini olakiniferum]